MSGPSAVQQLRHRIAVTAEQVGQRFPLHADTGTGVWTTTRRGSWTGGFWAGLLGLGGEPELARSAWKNLARWRDADTACRGLIFWYGRWAAPDQDQLREAASALARDFDAELGVVPWGTAFGSAGARLRVDSVAGLVPLLAWAGFTEVARAHLRTHLRWCFDGAAVQPSFVAEGTWLPADEPPRGTSRAHAWLLLGCVDGARWLGEEFRDAAVALARSWSARFGAGVPAADADLVDGPLDTSAAAIAAVAFLELAAVTGQRSWWRDGSDLLHRIVDSALVRSGPARGALGGGCYDARSGLAPAHELVWGDFFCAAGLGLLAGDLQNA